MIAKPSVSDVSEQSAIASVPEILLRENVRLLQEAISSRPSGILVTGYDRFTRRDVVETASPGVQVVSCCLFISGESPVSIECPEDTVLFVEDVDIEGDGIEGLVKGLFSRRQECCTIIGSANSDSSVPESLLRAGRFERIVRIFSPPAEAREGAWELILKTLNVGNAHFNFLGGSWASLSESSPGYVLRDFTQILHTFLSDPPELDIEDKETDALMCQLRTLQSIAASHKPMGGSADLDFVSNSMSHADVNGKELRNRWGGCGGYKSVKETLVRLCEWPVKHLATFERLGVDPPRGVLLHGPHGCGKTMLALGFLRRLRHANWLHVNAPDLFSKYLGDSEARVRALFERARSLVPCVVFIDELDAVGGERRGDDGDGGGSGVERRVLGSLLTELDGVSGGHVFVLACASSLEAIDPALVRPGRLDHVLEVSRPTIEDRKKILEELLLMVPLDKGDTSDDEDELKSAVIQEIALRTEGKTGADLAALCREAAMLAMEESEEPEFVSSSHFRQALVSGLPPG